MACGDYSKSGKNTSFTSCVVSGDCFFLKKKNSDAITLHLKIFTIKVDESQAHFREVPQYYSFDLTGEVLQYKSMSQLFS